MIDFFEDLAEIKDRKGNALYFSKFKAPHFLICRIQDSKYFEEQTIKIKGISAKNIPQNYLEEINVWTKLNTNMQESIRELDKHEQQERSDKMKNIRIKKRQKYNDIPKKIKCIKCKKEVEQAPSYTAAICRRKNILVEDYIKSFECKICNPRKKGRKINPKYAHLPKEIELKCSKGCGYKRMVSRGYVANECKRKGIETKEYFETYVCQNCNPTKGRCRKKGKALTNEENPNKVQCKICKDWKGTTPKQIDKIAKRKKWTIDKVYKNYVCRSCNKSLPESEKFLVRKKKQK